MIEGDIRRKKIIELMSEQKEPISGSDLAKKFGVSKSTVHKDLQDRLPQFNRSLYLQVKEVLEVNKAQRHIRGGMATRKKYKGF